MKAEVSDEFTQLLIEDVGDGLWGWTFSKRWGASYDWKIEMTNYEGFQAVDEAQDDFRAYMVSKNVSAEDLEEEKAEFDHRAYYSSPHGLN